MVKRTTKTSFPQHTERNLISYLSEDLEEKTENDSVLPVILVVYKLLLKEQLMEQIFRMCKGTEPANCVFSFMLSCTQSLALKSYFVLLFCSGLIPVFKGKNLLRES